MEVTQALEDLVAVESHIILRQGACNMELLTQGACTGHTGLSYICVHAHNYTHAHMHAPPPHTAHDKQTGGSRPDTYVSCLKAVECAYVTNDGNIQIPHQTIPFNAGIETIGLEQLPCQRPVVRTTHNRLYVYICN